jgi:hypothetical protein
MQMCHLPVEPLQAHISDDNELVRLPFDQDKVVLTFFASFGKAVQYILKSAVVPSFATPFNQR